MSIIAFFRAVPDFHKFLGIVIETFLMCCDDPDSDVRMIADECLTKIIRVSFTSYQAFINDRVRLNEKVYFILLMLFYELLGFD